MSKNHSAALVEIDEDTTTLRVPRDLRNSLKKIAYIQQTTLRDLTTQILQKHVTAYESGVGRTLESLKSRPRTR